MDSSNTHSIIRVFADDPAWETYAHWWMMPPAVYTRLHLATYAVEDQGNDRLLNEAAAALRAQYPHAVLVY